MTQIVLQHDSIHFPALFYLLVCAHTNYYSSSAENENNKTQFIPLVAVGSCLAIALLVVFNFIMEQIGFSVFLAVL